MTPRQHQNLPPEWLGFEAREPRKPGRTLELFLLAITAFFGTMGGLIAGGSWIFVTQREATVIRSDITNVSTRVSVLETRVSDHIAAIPNDTPSRTAATYAGGR
jgi:hypothetical protein